MEEKNITNIEAINLEELSSDIGVFIIGTALNERHAKTVSDVIEEKAKENDIEIHNIEGYDTGKWILIDLYDIIIHIFTQNERKTYDLEKLWRDGKFILKDIQKKDKEND